MIARSSMLALVLAVEAACFSESSSSDDDVIAASDETTDAGTTTVADTTTSTTSTTSASTSTTSTTADATGSSEGDTTSEGAVACADDEVAAIPIEPGWGDGWEGPFMVLPADAEGCGPALTDAVPAVAFESDGCTCDCAPRCSLAIGTCAAGDPASLGDGECMATSALERTTLEGNVVEDSCMPMPIAAAAGAGHRVCAGEGDCVAEPPGAMGPCIRHDGDVECPGPLQLLRLQPRLEPVCAECPSCAAAANEACEDSTLLAYTLGGCAGLSQPVEVGQCTPPAALSIELDVDVDCPRGAHDDVKTYCCL